MTPLFAQPRQNSPDYGPQFVASLHAGSQGQLLVIQSLSEGTNPRTIDLTPLTSCLGGGNSIVEYDTPNWPDLTPHITVLAAGTPTLAIAGTAGENIQFGCFSAAGQYNPPPIAINMTDLPAANDVVVHFAYSPWVLQNQTVSGIDCPGGSCTIPADPKIGPVYYCSIWQNSTGIVANGCAQPGGFITIPSQ
jgi:hypothetical protein